MLNLLKIHEYFGHSRGHTGERLFLIFPKGMTPSQGDVGPF